MIKHLDPKRLKRSMKNGKQSVFVETYRGSNSEAMSHHIKPCLTKKPDQIIFHVGTNDLRDKESNEIVNGVLEINKIIKKESPKSTVAVSGLIHRADKPEFAKKVEQVNNLLAKACQQHDLDYIDHKNIQHKHLNSYGLHLNRSGTGEMAKNFIKYLNSKYD